MLGDKGLNMRCVGSGGSMGVRLVRMNPPLPPPPPPPTLPFVAPESLTPNMHSHHTHNDGRAIQCRPVCKVLGAHDEQDQTTCSEKKDEQYMQCPLADQESNTSQNKALSADA